MKKKVKPMSTVTLEEKSYKLRSRKTVIPDFSTMDKLAVLVWINRNTTRKGYCKAQNPLAGMGGAIGICSKEV